jgi:hypothetical protein
MVSEIPPGAKGMYRSIARVGKDSPRAIPVPGNEKIKKKNNKMLRGLLRDIDRPPF